MMEIAKCIGIVVNFHHFRGHVRNVQNFFGHFRNTKTISMAMEKLDRRTERATKGIDRASGYFCQDMTGLVPMEKPLGENKKKYKNVHAN